MAEVEDPVADPEPARRTWLRRRRWRAAFFLLALIAIGLTIAWFSRERIAGNIIQQQFDLLDLPATYEIESIGPERQVLRNLVIGDPARPDMTIERIELRLSYGFGAPEIGQLRLVRPRLFGQWRDGQLTFGTLDRVIFAETEEPPALPELDLVLDDGRALLETDFGPVGFKAEGSGVLADGFRGKLAAVAPNLAAGNCKLGRASLYGSLTTSSGKPGFAGPLRLRQLDCGSSELRIGKLDSQVELEAAADFASLSGTSRLEGSSFAFGPATISGASGDGRFHWRDGQLVLRFSLGAERLAAPQVGFARLEAEGGLRMRGAFARSEFEVALEGEGMSPGPAIDRALDGAAQQLDGTLVRPLLARLRHGLSRELPGGSLHADISLRQTSGVVSGVIPTATLRGAGGATLLALSQAQFSNAGAGGIRLSGNIATGGADLPTIRGRMERSPGGRVAMRLRMEEYRAGNSVLAVPQLAIAQSTDGSLGFSGRLFASGPLPGGAARKLDLPVSGSWNLRQGLTLWRSCSRLHFAELTIANLTIGQDEISFCPPPGGAVVRADAQGLRVAAGIPALALAGQLGETPLRLESGAIGIAWPGVATAREVEVLLGPVDTASRFMLRSLDATLGEGAQGNFADTEVQLAALPLDITGARGQWRFARGRLELEGGAFDLSDRQAVDRFEPLAAQGASLQLADNVISARTLLRNPESGREVVDVRINHDLADASGHADLRVPGLRVDNRLQIAARSSDCFGSDQRSREPPGLTCLALGVVAKANGLVTGQGRVDWDEAGVTSSGWLESAGLDLAAAFGPMRDVRGRVEFTDLIGLTTAPGQVLEIGSINPGIEVHDGRLVFDLRDGRLVSIRQGVWPFLGGHLSLRPVDLDLGVPETRRYVIEIVGADAGQFLAQMELGNISATGTFDGTIPLVFDGAGNGHLEGGVLISRPPGGNLSYVGDLTYEDLSAMGNFAFSALRSLDFTQMLIEMDGPLTGEIVTRVQFDGVRQGKGASSNFVTRQIGKLPIRFKVNIRAPFYQLITSIRSSYDPAFIRDPRELGLIAADGSQVARPVPPASPATKPEDLNPDQPAIQPQESENQP